MAPNISINPVERPSISLTFSHEFLDMKAFNCYHRSTKFSTARFSLRVLRATEVVEELPILISTVQHDRRCTSLVYKKEENFACQVALLRKRGISDPATRVLWSLHVSIDVDLESGIGRRRKMMMKALRSAGARDLVPQSREPFTER